MFTGIIEELGIVKNITKKGNVTVLSIKADKIIEGLKIGDSIAVNGVCLTAVNIDKGILSFELLSETVNITNLGKLRIGEKVNLERALKVGDRLSGHFVTGHIDCLGVIRNKTFFSGNLCFEIAVPAEFLKFLVSKGSVAVDGISLTIAAKKDSGFCVYLIPHTIKNATLGFKGASDKVNIEFDILAKYAKKI